VDVKANVSALDSHVKKPKTFARLISFKTVLLMLPVIDQLQLNSMSTPVNRMILVRGCDLERKRFAPRKFRNGEQ